MSCNMPNKKHINKPERPFKTKPMNLEKFLWLRKNFIYCLALTALLWIVGISYYIDHFIGWNSIFAIEPADFGFFVLSVTVPLLLLWFILAYIERSSSLDANAELFQNYIENLLYPDETASKQARALAATLQEQTHLLQKENKTVIEQSAKIKTDLDARLAELSNILQLLDSYSAKTLTDLNDGVKTLADKCSYITDKTTNAVYNIRESSAEMAENASLFLSRINPLLDEISALSSNVKNNIADNKINLTEVKNQLEQSAEISQAHIDNMLAKTAENTLRIEQSFYKTSEEYEALYKRMDTSISSLEGRVEEQKRLISTQTKVLDHNSELLDNKLSKYGKIISQEIDKLVKNSVELEKITKKQISTLKNVNMETGKAIHGIGDVFDEKRSELERRCEYAVNSMQNVIIAINKETDKLISFTNLTQAKNYDLQNITETIVDKIGDISGKLALKTDALKDKAVEVIDKFTEASELITRSTDKINMSSNLVVTNGKQGVKLLEEQNFYINNAMTNMDLVKEKLDKLRQDIKKSAEEVTATLANYEKQIGQFNEPGQFNGSISSGKTQTFTSEVEQLTSDIDREKLIYTAKEIGRFLQTLGLRADKLYAGADIFDLWDDYLNGNNLAFTNYLTTRMTKKQIASVRKAFDDNTDFHNLVIKYLFLMDTFIKEMAAPAEESRDELINLSVNASLDRMYFILIKALNSAE